MEGWILATGASVIALGLAAFVQSATGFGFAVPLLSIFSAPVSAVERTTLSDFLITAMIAIRSRRDVQWRLVRTLTVASLVGIPIGLLVLLIAPELALTISGAVATVLAIWVMLLQPRIARTCGGLLAAGGLSGALLTATGINGPPLVAALHGRDARPLATTATLAALFAVSSYLAFVGFAVVGLLTAPRFAVVLIAVPSVLIGGFLGGLIIRRIDPRRYRLAVLGLLAFAAAGAIASSVAKAVS